MPRLSGVSRLPAALFAVPAFGVRSTPDARDYLNPASSPVYPRCHPGSPEVTPDALAFALPRLSEVSSDGPDMSHRGASPLSVIGAPSLRGVTPIVSPQLSAFWLERCSVPGVRTRRTSPEPPVHTAPGNSYVARIFML
jgi:hypothetical protein